MKRVKTIDCESPDRIEFIHSEIVNIVEFIEPQPCNLSDLGTNAHFLLTGILKTCS
ncbi:MAG: hypothetical protein PHC90_10045 [Syntrophorhabdaceae bacterium]|nr:hypothetical protein [Syntrophorhabdaceae bacterium]